MKSILLYIICLIAVSCTIFKKSNTIDYYAIKPIYIPEFDTNYVDGSKKIKIYSELGYYFQNYKGWAFTEEINDTLTETRIIRDFFSDTTLKEEHVIKSDQTIHKIIYDTNGVLVLHYNDVSDELHVYKNKVIHEKFNKLKKKGIEYLQIKYGKGICENLETDMFATLNQYVKNGLPIEKVNEYYYCFDLKLKDNVKIRFLNLTFDTLENIIEPVIEKAVDLPEINLSYSQIEKILKKNKIKFAMFSRTFYDSQLKIDTLNNRMKLILETRLSLKKVNDNFYKKSLIKSEIDLYDGSFKILDTLYYDSYIAR